MQNIYQQYLDYYNDINSKINSIDQLPYTFRIKPNVITDRLALVNLQKELYPIYVSDVNSTLAQFQQDTANIISQVQTAYNDALSISTTPVVTPSSPVVTPTTPTPVVTPITNVTLPPPTPTGIENSCWYITWTSWTFPIISNVNMINLFVGEFTIQADESVLVGGFGNATNALIDQLVSEATAKGIGVKISLGGGGGSYDNIWNVITADNVQSIANALVTFCQTHKLAGVDFDIEMFTSGTDRTNLQTLCGNLIKLFKLGDPTLQTSLCVNAGFGDSYPWEGCAENIINGTLNNGQTCLDRVYIMSYYNPLPDEQNWILGWYGWLNYNYDFTSSRISVGIDNTDSNAYNISTFAAWAKSNGFGTAYWMYNPATVASSDQSLQTIINSYYG
jgi:hypothetical protein